MTIYEQMLARYGEQDRKAHLEVMQQIALAGLYRAGFFEHAAFYGGTCLRIFHGLNRFSEDMDFSLLQKEKNFDFEQFFPSIINEFEIAGRTVEITKKDKRNFGKVESAFLKDTTEVYSLTFQYGTTITPVTFFVHDSLFLFTRFICWEDARSSFSRLEE